MNGLRALSKVVISGAGVVAASVALLGGAGCTAAENAAVGTKNLVTEAADATTDASISFAVRTALADDDVVNSERISVDTQRGVVTLRGTQSSEQARRQAERIASGVKGVRTVVDRIEVVPASIS